MANGSGKRFTIRQRVHNPASWLLDFDPAAPGGRGGGSLLVDIDQGFATISGVHKNVLLPQRSTGGLLAEALEQIGLSQPRVLESYNVDKRTLAALIAGRDGQGTPAGYLLENTVKALGGVILQWEPERDIAAYNLRVHIVYP